MEVVTTQDTTIKVGFSFSKAKTTGRTAKRESDVEQRDYVTDISGNQLKSLIPSKRSGPLVIPLDTQGVKRTKPITVKSETVTKAVPTQTNNNNDKPKEKTLDELAAEAVIKDAKNELLPVDTNKIILPIILQNQIEGIEAFTNEEDRFKYDVECRPDEAGEEDYENVPIEEFGTAMLRGMGWEVGKPIGLNNRGLTEPIEYVPRHGKLGLGATPETIEIKKKKYIKPGESREPKPILVAPTGPDGKVRHVKRISEKLVPLKKGIVGRLAAISSGPHEGLYARVIQELPNNDEVAVHLLVSEEDVIINRSDLNLTITESSLSENHPAYKLITKKKQQQQQQQHKEEEQQKNNNAKSSSGSKSSSSSKSSSKSGGGGVVSSSDDSATTWLVPHIMVRVVDKRLDGGRYYNKKGHVVDVVGRHECNVQLIGGGIVEGVRQKYLETVIPKPGGKVMIVAGATKGQIGNLLEKKKNDKNVECGVVQHASDLSLGIYELDDIAEFVGGTHGGDYYMEMI